MVRGEGYPHGKSVYKHDCEYIIQDINSHEHGEKRGICESAG